MEGQTTVRSSEQGWEMREHGPRKGPETLGALCLGGQANLGQLGSQMAGPFRSVGAVDLAEAGVWRVAGPQEEPAELWRGQEDRFSL